MDFLYRYFFHIMINQEFLYIQHWIWETPKSLYLNAYDKKNVFYSFENLYWVVSFFREREEDGEDDVILDIETSENVQSTSGKAIKASDAKKKAGRPAKTKTETTRSWTDDETNVLIEAWPEHENLCNTKHKSYFNRDIRQKSLTSMENILKDNGITATVKQIGKKLTDLKNYYGGQKLMIESSKSSQIGADEVYVSPWKFYEMKF